MAERMAPIDLPYLQIYQSGGKTFAYYRRSGQRIRLPEPGAQNFSTAYEAARTLVESRKAGRSEPRAKAVERSLRALFNEYQASGAYRQLEATTKADYNRLLKPVVDRFPDALVAKAERAWVIRRQSELAATPRTANYLVAVLRVLFSFAVSLEWMTTNPAKGVKPLQTGASHRVWTDAEIATLTSPAAGDVALPVILALYTAQRQADVLRLAWNNYDGRTVTLIEGKTKKDHSRTPIVIPVHPKLAAALDAAPRNALVICTTESGRPWTSNWFKHRFANVRRSLNLPDDLHFHGLRHSAAARLAEAGASDQEIKAVTGHKTGQMVARYTSGARQEQMATAAIARLSEKRS